jgi:hypothetical protein
MRRSARGGFVFVVLMQGQRGPRCEAMMIKQCLAWRVSSQATRSTLRKVSRARRVRSPRFPIGVATTYNASVFHGHADKALITPRQARARSRRSGSRRVIWSARGQRARRAQFPGARRRDRPDLPRRENARFRRGPAARPRRFRRRRASITAGKRQRIVIAARHYLAGKAECDCRFDCVLIDGDRLEWLKNAFSAD